MHDCGVRDVRVEHAEHDIEEIMFAEIDDGETDAGDVEREERDPARIFFADEERGEKWIGGVERGTAAVRFGAEIFIDGWQCDEC